LRCRWSIPCIDRRNESLRYDGDVRTGLLRDEREMQPGFI